MKRIRVSLVVLAIALAIAGVVAARQTAAGCAGAEVGPLLDRAAALLGAGDDAGARAALTGAGAHPCADLAIAQLAITGWVEARALAPKGGDTTLLAPVNAVLRALDAMRRSSAVREVPASGIARTRGLQIDYADAAIRAAVDAAQDERAEMGVFLDHAHDLALVLDAAGDPPLWPLPFDELAGELWLEVDRYAEARAAFDRAVARGATARSLAGLARTADRQGDTRAACDAYRRAVAMDIAPMAKAAAAEFITRCP